MCSDETGDLNTTIELKPTLEDGETILRIALCSVRDAIDELLKRDDLR